MAEFTTINLTIHGLGDDFDIATDPSRTVRELKAILDKKLKDVGKEGAYVDRLFVAMLEMKNDNRIEDYVEEDDAINAIKMERDDTAETMDPYSLYSKASTPLVLIHGENKITKNFKYNYLPPNTSACIKFETRRFAVAIPPVVTQDDVTFHGYVYDLPKDRDLSSVEISVKLNEDDVIEVCLDEEPLPSIRNKIYDPKESGLLVKVGKVAGKIAIKFLVKFLSDLLLEAVI